MVVKLEQRTVQDAHQVIRHVGAAIARFSDRNRRRLDRHIGAVDISSPFRPVWFSHRSSFVTVSVSVIFREPTIRPWEVTWR
jgi:hypothetical protein